jgi:hypothetical protein
VDACATSREWAWVAFALAGPITAARGDGSTEASTEREGHFMNNDPIVGEATALALELP